MTLLLFLGSQQKCIFLFKIIVSMALLVLHKSVSSYLNKKVITKRILSLDFCLLGTVLFFNLYMSGQLDIMECRRSKSKKEIYIQHIFRNRHMKGPSKEKDFKVVRIRKTKQLASYMHAKAQPKGNITPYLPFLPVLKMFLLFFSL